MTEAARTDLSYARPASQGKRAERARPPRRALTPESLLSLTASDLMSSPAISVRAIESVSSVARIMLESGVSAVPVLDEEGKPVGMASDGGLLERRSEDRSSPWLEMLAKQPPPPKNALERPVGEVMSAPLITVSLRASVRDIAELFQTHRVKRLPVLDRERLVGVVSRADLLSLAVESLPGAPPARSAEGEKVLGFLESLIGGTSLRGVAERAPAPDKSPVAEKPATPIAISANSFRDAVRASKAASQDQRQASKREAHLDRERRVKELLDQHVSDDDWSKMLDQAELAAQNGEQEFQMLRFPSDLCSDGGRMIDVAEEGWEGTLRGGAADLYSRWRTELKPQGFGLSARIVSYDDGIIGDIGLFLTWKGD